VTCSVLTRVYIGDRVYDAIPTLPLFSASLGVEPDAHQAYIYIYIYMYINIYTYIYLFIYTLPLFSAAL